MISPKAPPRIVTCFCRRFPNGKVPRSGRAALASLIGEFPCLLEYRHKHLPR